MPLYEYACIVCHHHFDMRHGVEEKPELSCPKCGGAVRKVFHASGIIFKGSGWYVTDSAPKQADSAEKSEKKEEKDTTKEESSTVSTKESTTKETVTAKA